uniref:Uncharacterized protein n=1 Tax=Oryza punctata TaxID=4537 RepID=A0A0E0L700_ORYPU
MEKKGQGLRISLWEEREVVAVMDVMRAVRVRSPGQDNPASMLTGKHPSKLSLETKLGLRNSPKTPFHSNL